MLLIPAGGTLEVVYIAFWFLHVSVSLMYVHWLFQDFDLQSTHNGKTPGPLMGRWGLACGRWGLEPQGCLPARLGASQVPPGSLKASR